jgi:hypothetical protein
VTDIVLELGRRVEVNFVGGLENGMGATILLDLCSLEVGLPLLREAFLRRRRSWSARTR